MSQPAQDYVVAFRRGEDFTPPAKGVFLNGQPDPAALKLLRQELASAAPSVRKEVVKLLVDMAVRTDPLAPRGVEVIRHREILALLAGPGLAKLDLGRDAATDKLRKLATRDALAPFGAAFVKSLDEAPSEEGFLLVAKAKPPQGQAVVERLAGSARWKDVEAVRIARAALGAQDLEDEYIKAADEATEGRALASALGPLGLIGTRRSLTALAKHLRTPVTIDVPGVRERSVRLDVLRALLYNFPDQTVLYPNNIIRDSDYAAAEDFCTRIFGVTYATPRPPFLTYRGYPIPLHPPE